MKIISIILVALGIILLAISLFPTQKICSKKHKISVGWKFLGLLITFFIIGYILYGFMLLKTQASLLHFIVSLILYFGSIFVVLVVRLSLSSIRRIERLAAQEHYRSLHDKLTELPNRALLHDRMAYSIKMSKRQQEPFAVLMMDLVRFREINESFGHTMGDALLQEVASRLGCVIRGSDTLCRFGGDEFVAVLPLTNLAQAVQVCLKISSAIDRPFVIEGDNINMTMSIGIAAYPEHGKDGETLLRHAETAMFEAKRNDVVYAAFEPSQDADTWNRLVLIGELREALDKEQLILHYQPKVSVKEKRLIGVEALVRWQHPERGEIMPNDFIPLIEQAGLSKLLTHWVLDNALEQSAIWSQKGKSINMSVNLSVKNLHDYNFPSDVKRLLEKWDTAPEQLTLEITETCMMVDQDRVNKVVLELKKLGINLSIDDFGTGYSSLSYLRRFPAKEIKIDKSFIIDMLTNESNIVIVRSTIEMAQDVGCDVVAEGVENEKTMKLLTSLGCDTIQGYHVCRPLSAKDLDAWIDSASWSIGDEKIK